MLHYRIWVAASKEYASAARGNVYVFANGANPNRGLYSIELPILEKNPMVSDIVYVDHPYLDLETDYQPTMMRC